MRRCSKCSEDFEGRFCRACGHDNGAAPAPPAPTVDAETAARAVAEMQRLGSDLTPECVRELRAIAQSGPAMQEQLTAVRSELEAERTRVTALEQSVLEARRIVTQGDSDTTERRGGFADFGEFLRTIENHRVAHILDPRLQAIQQRSLSMGEGAAGGFLVPPEFAAMLRQIQPQEAIVRPRATVIPASADTPDASVTMPAMKQGAEGVFAGVEVHWAGEATPAQETAPGFREVLLSPKQATAYAKLTDKLLRNSNAGPLIAEWLRKAMLASEDVAFHRGNGVTRPRGIIGHASAVNVERDTNNTVKYEDVIAMFWRLVAQGGGQPCWCCNPSVLPQLMGMTTPLGQLVWQPSAREGSPGLLLGIPLMPTQRLPVLGAAGDLCLCDWSYYVIKDGWGPSVQTDGGLANFTTSETLVKVVWNVDGQPWLSAPLLGEDGVNTYSGFVLLN